MIQPRSTTSSSCRQVFRSQAVPCGYISEIASTSQDGFDGGVLEVSFDNGLTFQDILTAGGTFIAGGYNGSVSTCCGNPLAGRQAWTGSSGGFIQSTVNLPIPLGSNVILRWRMGSDNSVSGEGWRVDSVAVTVPCPRPPRLRPRPTPALRP